MKDEERQRISGSFVLLDLYGIEGSNDDCSGAGGYDDFGAGMDVTVRDGAGELIGRTDTRNAPESELADYLSRAEDGEFDTPDEAEEFLQEAEGSVCVVLFDVEATAADYYEIEIGSRGDLSFSAEDLAESDGMVSLVLGSVDS